METLAEEASVPETADKKPLQENKIDLEKCIRVLATNADEPFEHLALLGLQAVPRPGDMINIAVGSRVATYSVSYVNFNPYEPHCHVTIGCKFSPSSNTQANAVGAPLDLKERMDQVTKSNIQIFEKAQAYTNAIVLAGYAGIFGLWTFSKAIMSAKGTSCVLILVGVSLFLFISWEIYQMVLRSVAAAKFIKLVDNSPHDFFQLLTWQEAESRKNISRALLIWRFVLIPTVVSAYVAAVILMYNAAANIFGLAQWP